MAKLKAGDCVQIKSGGPAMTITAVGPEEVLCKWFDGKKLKEGVFAPEMLMTSKERPAEA